MIVLNLPRSDDTVKNKEYGRDQTDRSLFLWHCVERFAVMAWKKMRRSIWRFHSNSISLPSPCTLVKAMAREGEMSFLSRLSVLPYEWRRPLDADLFSPWASDIFQPGKRKKNAVNLAPGLLGI